MARKQIRKPGPGGNLDYVPHGSDRQAGYLGLRKADPGDEPQLDGWTLEDMTMWGPTATDKFLAQVLRQKVNELNSKPPEMQSENPLAPNYAPPIWTP